MSVVCSAMVRHSIVYSLNSTSHTSAVRQAAIYDRCSTVIDTLCPSTLPTLSLNNTLSTNCHAKKCISYHTYSTYQVPVFKYCTWYTRRASRVLSRGRSLKAGACPLSCAPQSGDGAFLPNISHEMCKPPGMVMVMILYQ